MTGAWSDAMATAVRNGRSGAAVGTKILRSRFVERKFQAARQEAARA
jgi:hypothetical protein